MGWMVVESEAEHRETGQEATFYNVLPDWGPGHVESPDCWCEPEVEWYGDDGLVVHNEVH